MLERSSPGHVGELNSRVAHIIIIIGMGNSEPENQKFDPSFNMAEYNRKLEQMRHNYQHNTQINNIPGTYSRNADMKVLECQELTRSTYLHKPTIEIVRPA